MTQETASSDLAMIDLLRRQASMSVSELSAAMGVTATAVRQRLTRLMAGALVERVAAKAGRGRPSHRYWLTREGRRLAGANFMDLAMALWREIREIADPEVRDGLLHRISKRLAAMYAEQVEGESLSERMEAVADLFRQRKIPFEVDQSERGPVLTALACPYADLAEQDRSVCTMERMLFSEMLGEKVHSTRCRLDGDRCCTFQTS